MKGRIGRCLSLTAILLTGCGDQAELPEKGFVMGVAIDAAEEGQIALTSQIYRPSQGVSSIGAKTAETAYTNVETKADTVSKAIRDIPINLGRKAQWSHTRIIIIGEELARTRNIMDVLEYFYRDHEPRLTIPVMVAKGKADKYFRIKPHIENTIAQQMYQTGRSAANYSSKTMEIQLLKLGIQMKSATGNGMVPYLFEKENAEKTTDVAGLALLRDGKMALVMEPEMVEYLLMLTGDFKDDMIEIPCRTSPGGARKTEVVEVLNTEGKLQPIIGRDQVKVRLRLNMEIALTELICSRIETVEEEREFENNVERTIRERIEEMTDWLKRQKFDAIGLGDKIYARNPALWRKWKPDWEDRFARVPFDIKVNVRIKNSGTTVSVPAFHK